MKITTLLVAFALLLSGQLAANQIYHCGMIKGEWPPRLARATGTTCRLNVSAASPQEAFEKCNQPEGTKKPCCVENTVHRDIRGLGVLDVATNEVTHIPCSQ